MRGLIGALDDLDRDLPADPTQIRLKCRNRARYDWSWRVLKTSSSLGDGGP